MTVSAPCSSHSIRSHSESQTRKRTYLEVDSEATRPRRRDEAQDLVVRVEPLGDDLPLFNLGRPVETKVAVSVERKKDLEDVEDLGHLRENEDAMSASLALAQQLVELLQLAAVVLEEGPVRERDRELRARTLEDVDRRLLLNGVRLGERQAAESVARHVGGLGFGRDEAEAGDDFLRLLCARDVGVDEGGEDAEGGEEGAGVVGSVEGEEGVLSGGGLESVEKFLAEEGHGGDAA